MSIPQGGGGSAMMLPPVTAVTWPGTSSPGLTLGEITLPTYTATWPGTSDPSLTIT